MSVSDVEVTRDFDFATVFVTALLPDQAVEGVKSLNEMAKEFRRQLSRVMSMLFGCLPSDGGVFLTVHFRVLDRELDNYVCTHGTIPVNEGLVCRCPGMPEMRSIFQPAIASDQRSLLYFCGAT